MPLEALTTHLLPTTRGQAELSGGVKLELGSAPPTVVSKMAGNSMNMPCVGAIVMATMMCLSPKK
jgi:hypothetical protein